MNLRDYCEKKFEGSEYEKVLVSKPLRKIKGKLPDYRVPWKKEMKKANGMYLAVPI